MVWENYVIIYKIEKECVEIYRVINRFQDMTRILINVIICFRILGKQI